MLPGALRRTSLPSAWALASPEKAAAQPVRSALNFATSCVTSSFSCAGVMRSRCSPRLFVAVLNSLMLASALLSTPSFLNSPLSATMREVTTRTLSSVLARKVNISLASASVGFSLSSPTLVLQALILELRSCEASRMASALK